MFFWVRPDGSLANTGATQYHPGHWFDAYGNAVNWGDGSRVWVHYYNYADSGEGIVANSFEIGHFPEDVAAGDIYDLQGRKLSSERDIESLPRGIYIVGGRKVFVK